MTIVKLNLCAHPILQLLLVGIMTRSLLVKWVVECWPVIGACLQELSSDWWRGSSAASQGPSVMVSGGT